MKRFLISALGYLLFTTAALAQCNGVFPNNTLCGNVTGSSNLPRPTSNSVLTGVPGGSAGQIQYNNAGTTFGGFTASGACTINTSTGLVACGVASAGKTADYPIVSTDLNSTVVFGTGSTAQHTLTLPSLPSSGFFAGGTLCVKNNDVYTGTGTGHAATLSGFPSDLGTLLWPQQTACVQVNSAASGWLTTYNPGRWKVPQAVTIHFDKANGSNSKDGLDVTTSAVQDAQQAWNLQQYSFDNQGSTPILAGACSQTHTVALSMGGTPLGGNLVQLSPDGNCGFTWTNAGPCISIADLSELDLRLTAFGGSGTISFGCNTGNAAFTGNILLHNDVVLDLEGTPSWSPAGSNDNFLFCDGMCQFTIANGINQATAAGGNRVIFMSAGGHGTQSGAIDASASGTIGGIFYVGGPALLNRGTSDGASGHWASIGASLVNAHGTVITNGTTTSGGIVLGPTGTTCISLTATC